MDESLGFLLFLLCLLVVVCLVLVIFVFDSPEESKNNIELIETTDAGVIVRGYNSDGYILNNNAFTARIHHVKIISDLGEITQWIKVLQPQEKIEQYIGRDHGYYISTTNGVKIGWIRPTNIAKE